MTYHIIFGAIVIATIIIVFITYVFYFSRVFDVFVKTFKELQILDIILKLDD